jgi:molybdate transport system substrate-binding protein
VRRALLVLVGGVLLAGVLAASCGGAGAAGGGPKITVLAASSLTEAFQDLGRSVDVTYSFAGSQQLVAQVQAGAPVDVIATADTASMDQLVKAGLVEPPQTFARNRLAIAVERGNPRHVATLADLARPDFKVVLADPSVPAGRYAAQVLLRAGVTVRPVSLELDVKAVARKVAAGEADAAVVYATDVGPAGSVPIPDAANVDASYPVAVVKATPHPKEARAFVDALLGGPGRAALGAHGFVLP